MLINAEKSHLLVVDMQEKLLPAIEHGKAVAANAAILMRAADRLGVPVTISEQYPKGLGPTVTALDGLAPKARTLAKTAFACSADKAIRACADKLKRAGRDQMVICGAEAHVCVLQSALGFHQGGWRVAVVVDAIGSRKTLSKETAIARLAMAGVSVVTTEMVVFEWLKQAGTPAFKDLSALIK